VGTGGGGGRPDNVMPHRARQRTCEGERAAAGKSARQRSWLDVDDATSRTWVITLGERQHAAAADTHTLPSYVSTQRQNRIALAVLRVRQADLVISIIRTRRERRTPPRWIRYEYRVHTEFGGFEVRIGG